jgi:hypothetical protein
MVLWPQDGTTVPNPDDEDDNRQGWTSNGMIIGRGKPKYSDRNLVQCHFVHQKPYKYHHGIEPRPASAMACPLT